VGDDVAVRTGLTGTASLVVSDDDTSFPIRYRAYTFSGFYGDPNDGLVVDSTGWVSADLVRPTVTTDDALFADRKGTTVPYSLGASSSTIPVTNTAHVGQTNAQAATTTPTQALILHLHGKSGQRAKILPLK